MCTVMDLQFLESGMVHAKPDLRPTVHMHHLRQDARGRWRRNVHGGAGSDLNDRHEIRPAERLGLDVNGDVRNDHCFSMHVPKPA